MPQFIHSSKHSQLCKRYILFDRKLNVNGNKLGRINFVTSSAASWTKSRALGQFTSLNKISGSHFKTSPSEGRPSK